MLHLGAHEPNRDQLASHAVRNLAGAALVILAAAVVHRAGYAHLQWQYVAIAGALIPQVLVNVLAVYDDKRRATLKVSRRPRLILLVPAAILGAAGPASWLADGPGVPALAALCAAIGLAIAGSPATITFKSQAV